MFFFIGDVLIVDAAAFFQRQTKFPLCNYCKAKVLSFFKISFPFNGSGPGKDIEIKK